MVDPFPPRPEPAPSAVASRVQARLEQLAGDEPGSTDALPGDASDAWIARPQASEALELRIEKVNRQLQVLRQQLDEAFDEIDDRMVEVESRVGVAEARASVAEARASVAETRAADAETRANDAHHRVDEILGELSRLLAGPTEVGSPRQDLRGALERLRERLDVG